MFIRVPIDSIQPNPYQTRHELGDVDELARSIMAMRAARPETSGLLQVPPARLWDVGAESCLSLENLSEEFEVLELLKGDVVLVQLAAGHRRFQAFCELAREDGEYGSFAVELQVLTDEQMADIAWAENADREDLNPIDEALALRQAMETFGWTQEQVAARWRLSRSGVANKLRLLNLPEPAQSAIRAGEIGERHGRVLLSAMAKSPTVYEQIAGDVLPQPAPPEDALEKAHELAPKFRRVWAGKLDLEAEKCIICGGSIELVNEQVYNHWHWSRDGQQTDYMCTPCYRAATGWTSPSVSDAEHILQDVLKRQSTKLADVRFPHDVAIGEGDPGVRSPRCTECDCRADDGTICLDKRCANKKHEHWQSYQDQIFLERLRSEFGEIAPITEGYRGVDLAEYDEIDVALVRDGVCAPGKCERLSFRRRSHEGAGIRAFSDLGYIYNCNHSSSYRACQRRYLKAQRSEDEVEAEKLAKRIERTNREKAQFVEERAVGLVVKALRDCGPGVWYSLAKKFDYEAKKGDVVADGYIAVCARRILGHPTAGIYDWSIEDVPERIEKLVNEQLGRLGVTVPATTEDLVRRIERIEGFVLGENGAARQDLTAEQIKGNLDNLDQLAVNLMQFKGEGHLSQDDYERLNERVQALWAKLELAREEGDVSRRDDALRAVRQDGAERSAR